MRAAGEIFSEYRYVTVKFGQFLVPFPPRSDRRCKMAVALAYVTPKIDGPATAPARRGAGENAGEKANLRRRRRTLFQNSVTKR